MTSFKYAGDDPFFDAQTARYLAGMGQTGNQPSIVLREVIAIQTAIATAVAEGKLATTVQSSPMTTDSNYFFAWNDPAAYQSEEDRMRRDQMNKIRDYFSFRGYRISRNRVGTSNNFEWEIKW
ncbi:MAG: hypothetical protein D6698_11940 [Gammaproteobacteria bacterium]|nr:MAG: hypothetical protein D6698_11940 [Gammaproteobacteria bacterium]